VEQIYPRPYKLFNKVQHYEWGTRNENAFIPSLLNISPVKDLPYTELWIGAHPKASSEIEINGQKFSLEQIIEKYPSEILGKHVSKKFKNKFPFLLKVLSAAEALSIQVHPNKEQARKLHAEDPINYPDKNHKPEIAVALDTLNLIAGFKPIDLIKSSLEELIDLKKIIGDELISEVLNSKDEKTAEENILLLYKTIMKTSENKEELSKCIDSIYLRLIQKQNPSQEENQFIKLKNKYGTDVGLLSLFFFNMIELNTAQAVFTDAGMPHAYLSGNIIECMANSDNVIRAGLTKKFEDVNSLLDVLDFKCGEINIINIEQTLDEVVYQTSAEEFELTRYEKTNSFSKKIKTVDAPLVYLIISGMLSISYNHEGNNYSKSFQKGEAFLVPAILNEFVLSCQKFVQFFEVKIPE
jgi:mannose-6-phosphate isomerase